MRAFRLTVSVIVLCNFALLNAQQLEKGKVVQLPEMGPPREMKEMGFLIGNWNVKMKYRNDPDAEEWKNTHASATFFYIAGGAAIQLEYQGQFGGMMLQGVGTYSYDRETAQWQYSWVDNFAARISLYEGEKTDSTMVLTATQRFAGRQFLARNTTFFEDPDNIRVTTEQSFDEGETWILMGEASYTKRM